MKQAMYVYQVKVLFKIIFPNNKVKLYNTNIMNLKRVRL